MTSLLTIFLTIIMNVKLCLSVALSHQNYWIDSNEIWFTYSLKPEKKHELPTF